MNDAKIERIAEHMRRENAARAPFQWLEGDLLPASLDEAYRAQSALIEKWRAAGDGDVAGWKIAVTSPAMQALCGIDQPCVGAVLDKRVLGSPATVRAADFVRLGLEFELAIFLAKDVRAGMQPFDAASIRDFVGDVAPAFELIEDRGADYANFEARSLIADNTWNGGVVLGPKIEGWRDVDWTTAPVTLAYNDATETATTGAAMGDPFAGLAAVANNLMERGEALKAGQFVITGSTLTTRFASPGDRTRYEIDGLGAVDLAVEA